MVPLATPVGQGEQVDEQSDNDSGVLQPEDSLDDRGVADVLDEGWSPPERPYVLDDWGMTPREEHEGECHAARLAREQPEPGPEEGDGLGDSADTDGELLDDEVGDSRSGRLVADGAGDEMWALDVGIDGAAASAEEAAVHVIPEGRRN